MDLDIVNKLKSLRKRMDAVKKDLSFMKGKRAQTQSSLASAVQHKREQEAEMELCHQTRLFLVMVLEGAQNSIQDLFGQIGTAALQQVFSPEYRLKFEFRKPKSKDSQVVVNPAVDIEVVQPWRDGEDGETIETDLDSGEGGGMIDLVSFALRAAMLELYEPAMPGPLFLDENFRYIADDARLQSCGDFLKHFSESSDRQIFIITHQETLLSYCDQIFSFSKDGNTSSVVKL